jgi:hypothetical protein
VSLPAAVFVILFETARPHSTLAHRGARSQAAFVTSMTCVQTLWKGPASGAAWHALIVSIQQHVDRPAAEEKWVAHVNEIETEGQNGTTIRGRVILLQALSLRKQSRAAMQSWIAASLTLLAMTSCALTC